MSKPQPRRCYIDLLLSLSKITVDMERALGSIPHAYVAWISSDGQCRCSDQVWCMKPPIQISQWGTHSAQSIEALLLWSPGRQFECRRLQKVKKNVTFLWWIDVSEWMRKEAIYRYYNSNEGRSGCHFATPSHDTSWFNKCICYQRFSLLYA